MSLYDGIKDVAKVIQKADNIDLYRQLLDLCQQALDMQAEIERLTKENRELRNSQELQAKITRHPEPFVTLEGHPDSEMYCSTCYAKERVLIQVQDFHNGFNLLAQRGFLLVKYFAYPFGYIPKNRKMMEGLFKKYDIQYAFTVNWGSVKRNLPQPNPTQTI